MKLKRTDLRTIVRPSHVAALAALIGVALIGAATERQARQVQRQAEREAVLERTTLMRSELQRVIGSNLQLVRGYAAVMGLEPDLSPERMTALAAEVMKGAEDIRAIVVAPDMVVAAVYPLEGNAHLLGRDYRTEHYRAAIGARDTGMSTLSGPVVRANGEHALMARMPVFTGAADARRFWGLVTLVIDQDALLRGAGIGDPSSPIDLALIDRTDSDTIIAGDAAVLAGDPVLTPVTLPSRTWEIAAVPRGGWPPAHGFWLKRALFALAGLMIVLPILGIGRLLNLRHGQIAIIRQREAELSRLSWRLEFALATSNIGVWDADLATDRLIWDERAKALFGISADTRDFGAGAWERVVHPEDLARAVRAAEAAVATDGRFEAEYRIVLPDGGIRHVRDIAAVYAGGDGSRHLVGLVWDVTSDVARNEELNVRRLEAEAATVAKSRFLAAMSHEIRTPLGGVLGLLGLMLGDELAPEQRERATIALDSARSLLEILNDILDFSKLEAQRIRLSEESVPLREVARDVLALMRAEAAQKGLALTSEIDATVPQRVLTDPMRLRQVLTNLISNAVKFTDRGEIRLRAAWDAAEGGTLRIDVEDTGIGIDEANRDRIFEHFVQADGSLARRAGGTGLGLAISRQIVELMGGAIAVRSVPGMGSTFSFHVRAPRAEPAAAPPEPLRAVPDAGLRPLRVLLAEDHAANQYLIRALLGTGGHSVVVAANGLDAVAAVQGGGFDVVLMDMQMPVLDGLDAARRIRALAGPAAAIPIIALTANAMPEDRAACFAAGMTDYLSKPVEVGALLAALRRATEVEDEAASRPSAARA
ncbi:MAG: ATP-binding protein [Amaricoccus sp.]